MTELARRIDAAARKKKHTQPAIAAKLGVSQQMVSVYRNNGSTVPEHRWPALADYLGVSTEEVSRLVADADAERLARLDPAIQLEAEVSQLRADVERIDAAQTKIGEQQTEQLGMIRTVLALLGAEVASPSPKRRAPSRRAK